MSDDVILIPGDTTVVVQGDPNTLVVTPPADSLVVRDIQQDVLVVEDPQIIILQSNGGSGPQGPAGPAGVKNLYIQTTAPVDPGYNYIWVDDSGGNLNFWVETGHAS